MRRLYGVLGALAFASVWIIQWHFSGNTMANRKLERKFRNTTEGPYSTSVPFYVYSGPELEELKRVCSTKATQQTTLAEVFFLRQIEKHPWRVDDPRDAVVFVVPVMMGLAMRGCCGHNGKNLTSQALIRVRNSPYFKRHEGFDHLVVSNDFKATTQMWRKYVKNMAFGKCVSMGEYRCMLPVPATLGLPPEEFSVLGPYQTVEEYKRTRPYNIFFQGQADPRAGYKCRVKAMLNLPNWHSPNILVCTISKFHSERYVPCSSGGLNETFPLCQNGMLEGCAEDSNRTSFHMRIRQSKFNLFMRGDDPHSARMYDALDAGTVSIVLSDKLPQVAMPSQCQVPWESLIFQLSEKKFLLWEDPHSRVATNLIYNAARVCIPKKILKTKGMHPGDFACKNIDRNKAPS